MSSVTKMRSSHLFSFFRFYGFVKVWHAFMACFLFFLFIGIGTASAQIFQFMPSDENYAAALAVAFAEETKQQMDVGEKINLDENFSPGDFGVSSVGMLPNSPFYFVKDAGRGITSFFTFDPVKKAELRLQYASQKLLEAKTLAEQEGVSQADVDEALTNFKNELRRVEVRAEAVAAGGDAQKSEILGEHIMDSIVKYSKSLDKIEKNLPPGAFTEVEDAKDRALTAFGSVEGLVPAETIPEKLIGILDRQKGSEFKNFKNAEVLKEIGEKVPDAMKEAVQLTEENTLLTFQNELERLDASKKAIFQDFVKEVGGNELRHLEIIGELEVRPVSDEVREAIGDAKDEALAKTETRLSLLTPEQQARFSVHLTDGGNLEDMRVVKELENNIKPEVFQNLEGIKKAVRESLIKKFESTDQGGGEKEKILETVTKFHDAKSIAIFDELEGLIPQDQKGAFEEIKKRAADEIRKDIEQARNDAQKQVILHALAGDHPNELGAIEWVKGGTDKTHYNVFDVLAEAQFKAIQNRADQITDKDRLAAFETEVKKREATFKESPFDWGSIFGSLADKKKVLESPDRALEKVRAAEVVVSDFRDVVKSLSLDTAFSNGGFDSAAQEIGRMLEIADRRVEMARTVLGYNDVGRAYNEAMGAENIARDGLRMAQEYKSGKKRTPPPPIFFEPQRTAQQDTESGMRLYNEYEFGQYCFYVGGFMKARMYCALTDGRVFDVRGKVFPIEVPPEFIPRIDSVTSVPQEGGKCPAVFATPVDFCPKGQIVHGTDERGCVLPARCESYTDGNLRLNPNDPMACGGIAGYMCPIGLYCEQNNPSNVADAFGKCVSENRNMCQTSFEGFIFDSGSRTCRMEHARACQDPFVYQDSASCERAHSQTKPIGICPAMPTVNACPLGQKKVVSWSSPECGTYYACQNETNATSIGIYPYRFSNGYVVNDYMSAKEYCLKYPPGNGLGIAGECESKFGINYGTLPKLESSNWVRHFWKFSDGMTSESMILSRIDAEYKDYVTSIEVQCLKIPMSRFMWRPSAGNDTADNWRNFGIPDCSGINTTAAICGNGTCEMSETAQSCSQDCGGTMVSGSTCRSYTTQSSCQNVQCTWYSNHYDGTHCDDGAHGGSGTWTSTSTPLGDVPGAPTGLTATRVVGAVKLSWFSSSSNVLKFKIFRKTSGNWAFLSEMGIAGGTTGPMSYVDTGAPTDMLEYRVEACHATNCSMDSNIASAMTGSPTTYQCSDNKDNDGDGWIDYPSDSGCTSADDNDETYTVPPITPPGTSSSCSGSSASCTTSTQCAGAGYYWCTPTGYPAGCSSSPCPSTTGGTCSSTSSYCTTQAQCTSYNFYWCSNGTCASNSSMCGGGSGGGTASSMQKCFYTNATVNGVYPGYTVWCESDYYNCHQGSSTGAPVSTSGLSLGAPSQCESGWTTGGGSTSSCSSNPSTCTTQTECNASAYFWCNNACYGTSLSCSGTSSGAATCNANGVCDMNESYQSCPADCGGSSSSGMTCNNNGTCESNESYSSCASDCGGYTSSCSSTPSMCTTQAQCTSYNFTWCNNACYSNSSMCPTN